MKKAGRPSKVPKRLKDGYYILITLMNSRKPIRIMRENRKQMEQAQEKYKNHNFKYLGQVKDHFWIDGENKGLPTN